MAHLFHHLRWILLPSLFAGGVAAAGCGTDAAQGAGNGGGTGAVGAGAVGTGAGVGTGATGNPGTGATGNPGTGATGAGATGGTAPGTGGTVGVGAGTSTDGLPAPAVQGDAVSSGATITFQQIGAPGWYPSRRDPASGQCDAVNQNDCCMTQHEFTSDALTPWNEDLIMQLRGPILLERYAVYQPSTEDAGAPWSRVAIWDKGGATAPQGLAFGVDGVQGGESMLGGVPFSGSVGSTCVIDVMSSDTVPCGSGSVPYCEGEDKHDGWSGSKMFVLLAATPRMGDPALAGVHHCADESNGWYDAPWIGLTHGELVRSGKFGGCHCYAKNPAEWALADGCGQFNVFEVVNDHNEYANFDLFSTNLFAYHGYVGEGPCGQNCDVSGLPATVDLVNKSNSQPATTGATATPDGGPGSAFRRPAEGFRYFVILLDVPSRTIQMALIHPDGIPPQLGAFLPGVPTSIDAGIVAAMRDLRLPG